MGKKLDYLKCAWANKSVLPVIGLAGLVGLMGYDELKSDGDVMIKIGLCAANIAVEFVAATYLITATGVTYESYRRTKNRISKSNRLRESFKNLNETYCQKSGMNLAINESKLEGVLQNG